MGNIRIETKRLIIRTFCENDARDLHEYLSDPAIYVYEPGEPINMDTAREMVLKRAKGNDFLAVELKENTKLIGHLYFKHIEPEEFMTWELGYIFNRHYHRSGYGTESAGALVTYAFNNLRVHRIMARCDPKNIASWKLLERIGFRREGDFKEYAFFRRDENNNPLWHDAYEYTMLKKDYLRK